MKDGYFGFSWKNYTHRLIQAGYDFDDAPVRVIDAKRALGVVQRA